MNDFDLFLERQLREILDPVAAASPPRRRGWREATQPVLTVELPADPKPAVVTISAAPEL